MKVIKASQLIYSIYEGEEQQEIEISAIRVNRLCQRMRITPICKAEISSPIRMFYIEQIGYKNNYDTNNSRHNGLS